MEKLYTYKNAIIRVIFADSSNDNVRKHSEVFLRKVIEERIRNGNK